MDASSRDLLERARGGDTEAREALWTKHAGELRAYFRTRIGRDVRARESSQDLAQSVCREALADLERFEHGGEAGFRRWLRARAENKIRDRARFWRRERRTQERERPLGADPDAEAEDTRVEDGLRTLLTPSRDAGAREELARVERAFGELDPDQREVILLARVAGLAHAEIARAMGRTPAATRSLLSRALARLALLLEPRQGPNVTT